MLTGLTSFIIVLVLSMAVALVIFAIGRNISVKGKDTPGKLAPYACGEDLPPERVIVSSEEFFVYAVYFMIFHILAFILATTLVRPINVYVPIVYAGVSLISVGILTLSRRRI